jgi:hypothetical protein
MLDDDHVAKLLILKARDAEKRLLRARSQFDVMLARDEHRAAVDELERYRMSRG